MNYFELMEMEDRRARERSQIILDYCTNGDAEGLKRWIDNGQPLPGDQMNDVIPNPDESLIYALEFDCKGTRLEEKANDLAARLNDLLAEAKALEEEYNSLEDSDF